VKIRNLAAQLALSIAAIYEPSFEDRKGSITNRWIPQSVTTPRWARTNWCH